MILIGLGANLPSRRFGPPENTLVAALERLGMMGVTVAAYSRLYRSAPVPASDQPWYVNAVARVETDLGPRALLEALLTLEDDFGRIRTVANAARVLDLDLLAYDDMVSPPGVVPVLPHPRMENRAFVLCPLAEIAPDWRHPVSGRPVAALIAELSSGRVGLPKPMERPSAKSTE